MSLSKRLLRATLIALGILTATVLIVLTFLLATPSGSQFLVWQAERQLPQLSVERVTGSVLGGLTLSQLRLTEPDVRIARLQLNLSSRALLEPELVLESLSLSGLTVNLPAAGDSQTVPSSQSTGLAPLDLPDWLPPIRLRSIAVTDTRLTLPGAEVTWSALTLSARLVDGQFTLAPLRLSQSDVHLTPTDAKPVDDGSWPLTRLPDLPAPLPVSLKDIRIDQLTLHQGQQQHRLDSAALAADWRQDRLTLTKLNLYAPDYGRIRISGQYTLLWPYRLTTRADVTLTDRLLPEELSLQTITAELSGSMDALSLNVAEPALALKLQSQVALSDATLPFSGQLQLNTGSLSPLMPDNLAQALSLSAMELSFSGNRHQQAAQLRQSFHGPDWGSKSSPAILTASVSHGDGRVGLDELMLKASPEQYLSAQGQLDYRTGLKWELTTDLNDVIMPAALSPVAGRLTGQIQQRGVWQGEDWQLTLPRLQLDGTINQQPFQLHAQTRLGHHQQWFIEQLQLTANAFNTKLNVTGTLGEQWQIRGNVQSASIADLVPEADGSLEGELSLSGHQSNPHITVKARGNNWHRGEVQIAQWQLDSDYYPLDNHRVDATVTLGRTELQAFQTAGELHVSGNQDQHQLSLDLNGDIGAQLDLSGGIDQAGNWQGQIAQARWQLPHENLTLDQAITLKLGQQSRVSAHCWQGTMSQWCLDAPLTWPLADTTTITASVDYGSWATHWLRDQTLTGQAELTADLKPGNNAPVVTLTSDSGAGQWRYQDNEQTLDILSWQDGRLRLESSEAQWAISAGLNQQTGPVVNLQGQLTPANRTLNASLKLPGLALDKLLPVMPSLDKLKGTLAADIKAEGAITHPDLTGQVRVHDAQVRVTATQTEISQGQLEVNFAGQQLDYQGEFSMGKGKARLQGEAQWQDSDGPWHQRLKASTRVQGEKLTIDVLPELEASLSPNIHLRLDQRLSVTGKLTVDSGRLTIDQLPESAVQVSDDMVIKGQSQQSRSPLPLDVAMAVVFDEPFAIEAFDFKGAIDGQLTASQTSPEPLQLFGNLAITRGRYQAYGQDLEVQQGRLQFIGTPSNPVVQISAIRPLKNTDVKAGIRVSGLADSLSVNLFSEPAMNQKAILSYILTGRGSYSSGQERSTEAQGLLLAVNQGISLTGGSLSKAFNQVPVIRDVTFDTEANASGQALATVSGYISERLYLKYGVGLSDSVNELTVRYYLLNKLWLESLSGVEESVDLYYQFTIDDDDAAQQD